jgi:hypothetical protein
MSGTEAGAYPRTQRWGLPCCLITEKFLQERLMC